MGSVVSKLLGGGKKPKASEAPAQSTQKEAREAKKSRSALFETQGGVAGEELNPSDVKGRNTLLGN